jgi:hypothetical protein
MVVVSVEVVEEVSPLSLLHAGRRISSSVRAVGRRTLETEVLRADG